MHDVGVEAANILPVRYLAGALSEITVVASVQTVGLFFCDSLNY